MATPLDLGDIHIRRLGPLDLELAQSTFTVMAEVFGEEHTRLSNAYLETLLARPDFWVYAAIQADRPVGGLTAHTLMMTTFEGAEVFLYDIAIHPSYQRRGIGRQLVDALRRDAVSQGISTVFVPADNDDAEAIRFYAALGGTPHAVTLFEWANT